MEDKMKSVIVEQAKGLGIRMIELTGEALVQLAKELSSSQKPSEVQK